MSVNKKKVLFVCYGNIMRSQVAQGFYNNLAKNGIATSAATDSHTEGTYSRPADEVLMVMNEVGIDVSHHPVRHITEQMVQDADEVYVLTGRGDCPPYLADSPKATFWTVADPYGTSIDNFRKTRDRIRELVNKIL